MPPSPQGEGGGDPAVTAAERATANISSPFLHAAAAASEQPHQQRSVSRDLVEDERGGATAIEVGKPLPKSVAPLYAEYDESSGTESDSSFGSRLLDHDGKLRLFFLFDPGPLTSLSSLTSSFPPLPPILPLSHTQPGEETFGLQITREVEITNDEFEYLATGEVPQLPAGPVAPLLSRAVSRRREKEEAAAAAAATAAAFPQQKKHQLGGKHRHLFSARPPPHHHAHSHSEQGHEGGGGRDGGGDDYAYSSYYRKQAEHRATVEARRTERTNVRGAGLFTPWGRAVTSAREPHALFDPRKEARATRLFRGRSLLLLPLVHPHSLVSRVERIIVAFLDCTYSAFVVPIAIAYVPPKEYSFWSGKVFFFISRVFERERQRKKKAHFFSLSLDPDV